jgi:hypothetical protein
MKALPMFVCVRVAQSWPRVPALWLPICLLWPIVLIIIAPFLVVGLLVALVVDARSVPQLMRLGGGIYSLLCETRGTHVDVWGHRSRVTVSIR